MICIIQRKISPVESGRCWFNSKYKCRTISMLYTHYNWSCPSYIYYMTIRSKVTDYNLTRPFLLLERTLLRRLHQVPSLFCIKRDVQLSKFSGTPWPVRTTRRASSLFPMRRPRRFCVLLRLGKTLFLVFFFASVFVGRYDGEVIETIRGITSQPHVYLLNTLNYFSHTFVFITTVRLLSPMTSSITSSSESAIRGDFLCCCWNQEWFQSRCTRTITLQIAK